MYNFTDGSICGTIPNLDLQDLEAAVAPDAEVGPHAVAGELPDLARAAARVLDVAAGVGHVVTQDVAPVLEPGVEVVGAAAPDIELFNFNIDIQYTLIFNEHNIWRRPSQLGMLARKNTH